MFVIFFNVQRTVYVEFYTICNASYSKWLGNENDVSVFTVPMNISKWVNILHDNNTWIFLCLNHRTKLAESLRNCRNLIHCSVYREIVLYVMLAKWLGTENNEYVFTLPMNIFK